MKIATIIIASIVASSSIFAAENKMEKGMKPNAELMAARMISSFDVNQDNELNPVELETAIDAMLIERVEKAKDLKQQRAAAKGKTVDSAMTFMLPVGSEVAHAILADFDLDGNGQASFDELKKSTGTIRKFNLSAPRGEVKGS